MEKMKKLYLSFAPPRKWRNPKQTKKLDGKEWKRIRQKILERDNHTCVYCGYKSEKYQIIDHIDGDPENNKDKNFQIVCQMCNLIKHSGQGVVIRAVVDLYKKSKYPQNEIIKVTREMRDNGKSDEEIISFLGLKDRVDFKMDRKYLKKICGFLTSRRAREAKGERDMYNGWLDYHNSIK